MKAYLSLQDLVGHYLEPLSRDIHTMTQAPAQQDHTMTQAPGQQHHTMCVI